MLSEQRASYGSSGRTEATVARLLEERAAAAPPPLDAAT